MGLGQHGDNYNECQRDNRQYRLLFRVKWHRHYGFRGYEMGQPGSKHNSPEIKRNGDKGRYRSFPIVRHKRTEYHVYLGFSDQVAAEKWVDWGVRDGFLTKGEGMKKGLPGKPK